MSPPHTHTRPWHVLSAGAYWMLIGVVHADGVPDPRLQECAAQNRQTWIRSDGPYGYLNFDYRRYGVILLAGGGIGVTPVVSLLGEIYGAQRSRKPHAIRKIHAVWVMPAVEEAELFLGRLQSYVALSEADPTLPELVLAVHCTRAKGELAPPLVAKRPDFPSILDQCRVDFPESST